MRWWLLGLLLYGQTAYADEVSPAVLNDPKGAAGVVEDVITRLDPSYETFWNIGAGEFQQGVSASLYNFTSNEVHIASARLGLATGETPYAGVGFDLPGLAKRFVPQTVKGIATTKPLDVLWALVGRYARVGLVGGYNFNENEPAYGITAGAALGW